MTRQYVQLVQDSFKLVEPIADTVASQFYARLFELDPTLRSLFTSDTKTQRAQVVRGVGFAVRRLDDLEALVPVVEQLGRRFAARGVQPEHYGTVARALIWALERNLGDAFTPSVRGAWVMMYSILSSTMQRAAAATAPVELPAAA
jgi:hemoglobin-like flavoprotein